MLNRIRLVLWTVILVLTAIVVIPTFLHRSHASKEEHGEILTILHTNDHHGALLPIDGQGGIAQRATLIRQERAEQPNLLLLDAGDLNTGTPLSDMNDAEPDIRGYNLLKYDAMALGNHEFDKGLPMLDKQFRESKFTWLCANLKRKSDGALLAKPYIVKDFKTFRVGIFGLSVKAECDDIVYEDPIAVAREMVSQLRDKEHVQLVVALTHLGIKRNISAQTTSIDLAKQVSGIDLIVDGHSHTLMEVPLMVNHTPIVSAFEFGKRLGEATFEFVDGKPHLLAWRAIHVTDQIPAAPEMKALLQPYVDRTEKLLNEPLAETAAPFENREREIRYHETSLADFVCDSLRESAKQHHIEADFVFITGGCIRTGWPKGTITYQDVLTTIPFNDHLYTVTLDGTELARFFDFVGQVPSGAGGFGLFSSEVRFTLHRTANGNDGGTISDITIQGQPIDPARKYTMLTSAYLANGGDHYDMLKAAAEKQEFDLRVPDALVQYLRTLKQPIEPKTDGRIRILPPVEPQSKNASPAQETAPMEKSTM